MVCSVVELVLTFQRNHIEVDLETLGVGMELKTIIHRKIHLLLSWIYTTSYLPAPVNMLSRPLKRRVALVDKFCSWGRFGFGDGRKWEKG